MKKLKGLAIAALLSTVSTAAMAQDPLDIVFTVHSGASNTFWQAVQKGYEDACAKVGATCQMVYVQTDGSIAEQVANMEAALARQPDALITSIIDNTAFDDVIQRARHPYTEGLMGSIPKLGNQQARLAQIDGAMPRLTAIPKGCAFNPRCPNVFDRCRTERPNLIDAGATRAACWRVEPR